MNTQARATNISTAIFVLNEVKACTDFQRYEIWFNPLYRGDKFPYHVMAFNSASENFHGDSSNRIMRVKNSSRRYWAQVGLIAVLHAVLATVEKVQRERLKSSPYVEIVTPIVAQFRDSVLDNMLARYDATRDAAYSPIFRNWAVCNQLERRMSYLDAIWDKRVEERKKRAQ